MAEPEPVFVIHGVNVRGEQDFRKEVEVLNRAVGNTWRFIPIYWGDLGGNDVGIDATIPRLKAIAEGVDAAALLAGPSTRAGAAEIAATAAAARARGASSKTRGPESSVYEHVRDQWPETQYLRLIEDATMAEEIGTAIGEAIAAADEGDLGVVRAETRGIITGIVHAFDRAVGSVVGRILARLNEMLRLHLGPTLARFLGDVFVYKELPSPIEQRLLDALKAESAGTSERPATVLAHSMGGVITFSMATRGANPIYLRRFLTFGSQSAFFHVVHPIGIVAQFTGTPVKLPVTIQDWLNVWEPLDPLAFLAAGVFRLASGSLPKDRILPHRSAGSLWTHSSYWTDRRFAEWVADFIK